MEITRGKINKAKKVIVYGPEGIGKSTFAGKFLEPLFIDTEESTKEMDVARLPAPSSWQMILEEVRYVRDNPDCCRTLIMDTADKAQQYAIEEMCAEHQCKSVEDPGYGKGYVYVYEKFGKLLNLLDEVIDRGINVVVTAHATMRKFEQPDELGSYDRWEMKLIASKNCNTSALLREWADMVLFANYKTHTVTEDKEGKKKKALGAGRRVMYTTHHSCWDAKNRYGLPDELDFDYAEIAHIFKENVQKTAKTDTKPQKTAKKKPEPIEAPEPAKGETAPPPDEKESDKSREAPPPTPEKANSKSDTGGKPPLISDKIPKALRDLMAANHVSESDIKEVVAERGYYPGDVEIWDYEKDFIDGCLIGAWDQVKSMIDSKWQTVEDDPFNIPFDKEVEYGSK